MTVKSSAYASTLGVPVPSVRLFSCIIRSSLKRSGFMHMVKSTMLNGHPCLMPLRISIGSDMWSLRNILHEIRKRKANWIGHILRRNCLLKQVIEGKMKEEMEVTRRRARRLNDLKDRRG